MEGSFNLHGLFQHSVPFRTCQHGDPLNWELTSLFAGKSADKHGILLGFFTFLGCLFVFVFGVACGL